MEYMQLEGRTLGEYAIRLFIRKSFISEMYLADQLSLNRRVEMKILDGRLQGDGVMRQAFMREAEIMAQLEHPAIVPIYGFGTQDGISYIARRYMAGGKLSTRLQNGPAAWPEAAALLKQIANGLDYVHSTSMVVGNVKPDNIVFDTWGNAYLVGFSLSGLYGEKNIIAGTPLYMAPEVWLGEGFSPASDQYSLGVSAFEIITGRVPFDDQMNNLRESHLHDPIPPLQKYNPEIPLAVNNVIFRAMAKNPDERYPTVMDFAREFEKALAVAPRHLFISYSRRDKAYAQLLSDHLQHNGFGVWIDANIEYGDAWFDEIDEAIKTCAAFVLVMSPESQESEWVRKEILLAKRYKKALFPLLLDGEEFPIVIDIQFADVKGGVMPDTTFHRRLRRAVFGDA